MENKKEKTKNKKSFLIKLGDFIANYRYFSLIIFLGLFLFGLVNINNVKINDSIVSYLPNNTETKQGLDIMEKEFGSLNTIKLMISNISLEDANNLTKELAKLENVESVVFDGKESSYKNE